MKEGKKVREGGKGRKERVKAGGKKAKRGMGEETNTQKENVNI